MQCQARFTHFVALGTRPRPGPTVSYETLDRDDRNLVRET